MKFRLEIAINWQAILFHKYTKYANYYDWNAQCRLSSLIYIHIALIFGYQLTLILDIKLLDSHCGILHSLPFGCFSCSFRTCFAIWFAFERQTKMDFVLLKYKWAELTSVGIVIHIKFFEIAISAHFLVRCFFVVIWFHILFGNS